MPKFQNDPVVSVSNSTVAPAVQGEGSGYEGVRGVSHNAHGGVVGINDWSPSAPPGAGGNGGWFESSQGEGVRGWAKTPHHGGVVGVNTAGGFGVYGKSDDGNGVVGESQKSEGVRGVSHAGGHGGVVGINDNNNADPGNPAGPGVFGQSIGTGVWGTSKTWMGVYGNSESTIGGAGVMGEHKSNGAGVIGKSIAGIGVYGTSDTFEGMHAETKSTATAAMAAYQLNPNSESAALFAKHAGNRTAAVFEGNVKITGTINSGNINCTDVVLSNADCAEDFDIVGVEKIEPGTVMVIDHEGALRQSQQAYDKRVAGVISGAGEYRPGIILDKQQLRDNRMPVALLGKVFCKVDAHYFPVEVGDLLTTSPTPGHAMKAQDPLKGFGSVIGKALRPLADGQGLIPILIALQ